MEQALENTYKLINYIHDNKKQYLFQLLGNKHIGYKK